MSQKVMTAAAVAAFAVTVAVLWLLAARTTDAALRTPLIAAGAGLAAALAAWVGGQLTASANARMQREREDRLQRIAAYENLLAVSVNFDDYRSKANLWAGKAREPGLDPADEAVYSKRAVASLELAEEARHLTLSALERAKDLGGSQIAAQLARFEAELDQVLLLDPGSAAQKLPREELRNAINAQFGTVSDTGKT